MTHQYEGGVWGLVVPEVALQAQAGQAAVCRLEPLRLLHVLLNRQYMYTNTHWVRYIQTTATMRLCYNAKIIMSLNMRCQIHNVKFYINKLLLLPFLQ